ncbi:hypothetical protein FRC07_013562, partial [Ceratobasidium sp. 392]
HLRRPTGDEKAGLASVLGWKGNTGSSADFGPGPGPGVDLRAQWRANSIFGVGERGLLRAGSIFGGTASADSTGVVKSVRRGKGKMGKEWKGRGMCGVAGFVRHQGLTVLYAEYVDVLGGTGALGREESTSTAPPTTAVNVTGGEVVAEPKPLDEGATPGSRPPTPPEKEKEKERQATRKSTMAKTPAPKICVQAHWRTYRYFRFRRTGPGEDVEHREEGEGAGKVESDVEESHNEGRRDSAVSASTIRRDKDSPTSSRTNTQSRVGGKKDEKVKGEDGSELALDEPLGCFVSRLCGAAEREEVCCEVGCGEAVAKHRMSWIHNHMRIILHLSEDDEWVDIGLSPVEPEDNSSSVKTWVSCGVCGEKTEKQELGNGGYLFSLAKFLELLIYSPTIASLSPSLCSHTRSSKHAIVRHFSHSGWTVAFETSDVRDVYEVKVPKVRMLRTIKRVDHQLEAVADDRVKNELRLQVTTFWRGVKDYLDELESYLEIKDTSPATAHKRLPTTPPGSDPETDDGPR